MLAYYRTYCMQLFYVTLKKWDNICLYLCTPKLLYLYEKRKYILILLMPNYAHRMYKLNRLT